MVIEDIAGAATSQAMDVDAGFNSVQELDRVININVDNIEKLNHSTEELTSSPPIIMKGDSFKEITRSPTN